MNDHDEPVSDATLRVLIQNHEGKAVRAALGLDAPVVPADTVHAEAREEEERGGA